MMWSSLDAVGDRTLIAASFAARLQTYRPAGWRDIHRKVDRGVEILVPGPYKSLARRAQIPSISSKRTRVVVGCFGTPWRSLEQFELPGPCHRLRAAVRVELAVEVVEVGLDGAHADEELGGDLTVGLAGGYELKDLALALAQVFGELRGRRRDARSVPLQHRQELPEVVRRDWRVQTPSLSSFECPGQEFVHRRTLVGEGPDVALRFGQNEGFSQGAHGALSLAFCLQGQRLQRQYLYSRARGLCRLAQLRQQLQRFARLVSGDQQPCQQEALQLPGLGPDFAHARRSLLLGGGGCQIPTCQVQPRLPDRRVDDRFVGTRALGHQLRFPGRREGALLVALREPYPREDYMSPHEDPDVSRSPRELHALRQVARRGVHLVPLVAELARRDVHAPQGWQQLGLPLGCE